MTTPTHHKDLKQGSDEWFAARVGRFTSSKAGDLLANGRGKDSIGLTFYSYIYETVENELFGEEAEAFSGNADTERGNELEPIAFEAFRDQMALEFIEVEKCGFFTLGDHEGSSPDGLVGADAILEIKAPKRGKFFKIVRGGIDAVDKGWKDQVQHQMRVTGRNRAYIVFIHVSDEGRVFLHHIEVPKDEEIQAKFEDRLLIAIKEKKEYKQYLIEKYE